MVKVKVCGITNSQEIQIMNESRVDYIGFVFANSRRQVTYQQAKVLKSQLSCCIQSVGVFANEPYDNICKLLEDGIIDVAQLHGQEDISMVEALKKETEKPVIKAITGQYAELISVWNKTSVDYLLFDSGKGSGQVFDWNVVKKVEKPFFLAGGLTPFNVGEANALLSPFGVDVSSGVERHGKKDQMLVEEFLKGIGRRQ